MLDPEIWARLSRLMLYVDEEDHADLLALCTAYDIQAAWLAAHQAVLERLRDRAHFSSDPYSRDYAEWIDAEMATLDG